MKKTFTNSQIRRGAHLPPDFIQNLVVAGVIKPTEDVKGQGRSRKFDEAVCLQILIARELWVPGIQPKMMKPVLERIDAPELLKKVRGETDEKAFWFLLIKYFRRIRSGYGYEESWPAPPFERRVTSAEELGALVSNGSHIVINLTQLLNDMPE